MLSDILNAKSINLLNIDEKYMSTHSGAVGRSLTINFTSCSHFSIINVRTQSIIICL